MISITLPSLYNDTLMQTIESIQQRSRFLIEILVVSPHDQPWNSRRWPNLIWIKDPDVRGCAYAHTRAFESSTGEFVFPLADDLTLDDGWDEAILNDYRERERDGVILSLGMRMVDTPDVSTIFGLYYPCFPLMRREHVEKVGGWLYGGFKYGLSDADLALRVWASGGRCEWSKVRAIRPIHCFHPNAGGPHGLLEDAKLLRERWPDLAAAFGGDDYNIKLELAE